MIETPYQEMPPQRQRFFTIQNVVKSNGCPTKFKYENYAGRYTGTPSRAAEKALNQLCSVKRISGPCSMYISIRETTRGSSNKIFTYHVTRQKDDRYINRGGRSIHVQWKTKTKSLRGKDAPSCKNPDHRQSSGRRFKNKSSLKKSRSRSRSRSAT